MAGSPRIIARPTQPPIAAEPATVLASVNDKSFGGAEEAPSETAAARIAMEVAVGTVE